MVASSRPRNAASAYADHDVIHQLKIILAHEWFVKAPVLSSFLKYIVEETLAGNVASLKEYTIAVSGLGKKPDFDPQTDAIVRIHAGRLRRLLAEYYNGPGADDRLLVEVARGSYVPVFTVRSYKQDMPGTLKLSLEEIRRVTFSKVTVAILPFRNVSPHSDHQFFVDGLGEDFTSLFSTSEDFAVIGHQSTLRFSEHHVSLQTIGSKLNAQYIITGAVMRSETYFRVNVGLVETQTSTQIWSRMFDYDPAADLMEVQHQTIEQAYASLGGQFGAIIRHRALKLKSSFEASVEFDPAVWNYHFHMNFSFYTYACTRRVLELARENDPHHAKVLAMLSELYLWGHMMGFPTIERPVATAVQLAQKAVNIDPQSNHACFSLFWSSLYKEEKETAQPEAAPFLNLDSLRISNAGKIGVALVCSGEYEGGSALLEQAARKGQPCPWSFDFARCLLHFRHARYAEALESLDKIAATDIFPVDLMRVILYNKLGHAHAEPLRDSLLAQYTPLVLSLEICLRNFLLDDRLVHALLSGAREAGFTFG